MEEKGGEGGEGGEKHNVWLVASQVSLQGTLPSCALMGH